MKRWFAIVTVGIVLLYGVLAVGAAGCMFMPTADSGHTHHTPSHAGHSMLCIWACQENQTVGPHSAAPALAGVAVVTMHWLGSTASYSGFILARSSSRAPPSVSLL